MQPILIDISLCPKAEEFVRLEKLYKDYPDKFSFAAFAGKAKIDLWKFLNLESTENDEWRVKDGVFIITNYKVK